MSPGDHFEVVGVVELFGDVLAEGVAGASRVHPPPCAVVGVGPEEIAHWALVGHFLVAF